MSSNETTEVSTVHRLAKELERDMYLKSLSPGDPYLSATQAARVLGVSRSVADRALSLLAKQNLVIRRPGQGTQIGSAMRVDPAQEVVGSTSLQSIFLLEGPSRTQTSVIPPEAMLPLAQKRFRQAAIHTVYLPQENTVDYVKQLISRGQSARGVVGVIAKSCTRPVYDYLAECHVPTVVLGTLYADQREALPSIDFDYYEAGRLQAQGLAGSGHQRIGVLLGSAGRAGTENFLNGVLAGSHAAGISPAGLVAKFYPGNDEAFAAMVKELLTSPNRPTALIGGGGAIAELASTIASDLGILVPEQLEISRLIFEDKPKLSCPCVKPMRSRDEIITQVLDMLSRRLQGKPLEEHTVMVPIANYDPNVN